MHKVPNLLPPPQIQTRQDYGYDLSLPKNEVEAYQE